MREARLDPKRMGLNKWEMHKALKNFNVPSVRIPETRIATFRNIARLLRRHSQVFIKPVGTWGGQQIARVTRQNSGSITLFKRRPHASMPACSRRKPQAVMQSQKHVYLWEQQGAAVISFTTQARLNAHLLKTFLPHSCIVQAAAPLLKFQGRPFDIRLLMQRDVEDDWVEAGTVVRIGGPKSIVSNIEISKGEVVDLRTLCTQLRITPTARIRIEQHLRHAGLAICSILEPYRHFNEVGIDFGLAANHGLWIIEVNTDDTLGSPSHELFAHLPDPRVFQEIEARTAQVQSETVRLFLEEFFR